jgi:hypothetical protein
MIALVDNPDDIRGFMERFKTETAHAINRLLGKRKRTVWCKGYDSPTLLTLEDAINRTVYLYTNPAKDNLVRSINSYPGLSSWKDFKSNTGRVKSCPRITRDMLFPLKSHSLTRRQLGGLSRSLKKKASASHPFTLFPDAWLEAFRVDDPEEVQLVNQRIIQGVREREAELEHERQQARKRVLGAEHIAMQPMDISYEPKRSGKKMWCICGDIQIRKKFVSTVKELVRRAREVFELWKSGDFSFAFPAGLFPPCMPKLVEPLTIY